MSDIRNITFSNIKYLGTDNNDILLSNSKELRDLAKNTISKIKFSQH